MFAGEDRILVPSPKVATYDLQPEMSAPEVTERLCEAIRHGGYDLIVVNYANPDMVGHTGVLKAAQAAVKTIDASLGRLAEALVAAGGTMLITADHGNIECLRDPDSGQPHTAHTVNQVPLILVNGPPGMGLASGRLADVARSALSAIAEQVVPDRLHSDFGDGKGDTVDGPFDAVAVLDQAGGGGDLLGLVVDPLWIGGAAPGRVDIHLVGIGIRPEQRLLTLGQLVRILVHVGGGNGEKNLIVRERIDVVGSLFHSLRSVCSSFGGFKNIGSPGELG